jgi:type IV secretory pathway component VirB8
MLNRFLSLLLLAGLGACNNTSEPAPVTELEVAETFIYATLKNNLDKAEQYLLKDSVNMQLMDRYRESNKKLPQEQLESYKKSGIVIKEVSTITKDSVVVISYSPSYKKEIVNKLKMVRAGGKWLVDLKYTFLEKPE